MAAEVMFLLLFVTVVGCYQADLFPMELVSLTRLE
jgi:hypothetical protein